MKQLLITFFSLLTIGLFAQQDLTLYEMRSMPQAHMINPSKMPYSRGYVLLPALSGVYLSINNTGFTYADAFTLNGDSIDMDLTRALERMDDLNEIGFDFKTTLFGFGFRSGASYFTFNVETKLSTRVTYPKTLLEFAWYGNGSPQFLGNRIPLDGLGLDFMQYNEIALGYARDINEDWTIGFKGKVLSGVANLQTTESQLGLRTDPDDYGLYLDGKLAYRSAGAMSGFLDSNITYEDALVNSLTGNLGFAADFGATYRVNDKLSFNASVIDLGYINWKQGVNNRATNEVTYGYRGESLDSWLKNNNTEGFRQAIDSLGDQIQWTEDSTSYSTWLPTKTYFGVNYQLFPKTDVNALTYNEFYNGSMRSSIRFGITQRVRNFIMASLNYSIYGKSAANIGAGLTLNGGPWQLYFVTDNALAFVLPTQVKNYHFRVGINLTFSKKIPKMKF